MHKRIISKRYYFFMCRQKVNKESAFNITNARRNKRVNNFMDYFPQGALQCVILILGGLF